MRVAGVLLVLSLAALYAAGIRAILQVPFRALGILVSGMAFHNIVLMILLRLETPHVLIRAVQAWKEGILLLLLGLAVKAAITAWRTGRHPRLLFLDWVMVAFTGLVLIYGVLPPGLLKSPATYGQRLLAARIDLLLPLLYLFGRVFWTDRRADLVWVITAITGSAAAVGLLGFVELWTVPTRLWLDAGVNQLSSWFGFTYHGPRGLPENFFQTAATGLYLRRAVSTYVSPLGIAYTGLLVVPPAIAFAASRPRSPRMSRLLLILLGLVIIGVLFTVTRLALALLAAEVVLLTLLLRRAWLVIASVLVAVGVVLILFAYPRVGPLVDAQLNPVHQVSGLRIVSTGDPSLREHAGQLGYDLEFVILHPLGAGLGSALHRFGSSVGPGESAVFDVFGELGVIGGALYLPAYFLVVIAGLRAFQRARSDLLNGALPLIAGIGGLMLFLITVTSDVWGDLSVTFLFWWAAGYSVAVVARQPASYDR